MSFDIEVATPCAEVSRRRLTDEVGRPPNRCEHCSHPDCGPGLPCHFCAIYRSLYKMGIAIDKLIG